MPIFRSLPLLVCCAFLAPTLANAQPSVTAVLNGASFEPVVAPGSLVAIYGQGLANVTVTGPGVPLPTTLGGTSVQVNGVAAGLYYVSDTQVNAVVPLETPAGSAVPVVVRAASGSSQAFRIKVDRCAPAIFTVAGNGTGRAIVFSPAYRLLDQVAPGDSISFYATGLGSVALAPDGYTRAVATPSLFIGESQAMVTYAGVSGYPGVYQVNAIVPDVLASERFYLSSAQAPFLSNISEIGIPSGNNTVDASGDIQALYPRSTSNVTFSQVLSAARFHARFTVAPLASPFTVAAISDAGSMLFLVDPTTGRIAAGTQVPTAAERAWDFSRILETTGFPVLDFLALGNPFPAGIVPINRVDPAAATAAGLLPMANVVSLQGANFVAERQLPASGPVVLDDSTGLNVFGNFHSIPYTPYLSSRSTGFKLYIDGKLIASDKVTYSLPSTLPVGPPVALKSIALGASSVNGGSTLQAVVSLVATAPEGGEVVTLASDNAAASVPASVTVPAGQSALSFTVFTRIVTSDATAVITATAGSVTKSATLTVTAPR